MKFLESGPEWRVSFDDGSKLVAISHDDEPIELPRNGPLLLNLVRLSSDGEIVWFISAEPKSTLDSFFNPPILREGTVYTTDYHGYEFEIDEETGRATPTGRWYK